MNSPTKSISSRKPLNIIVFTRYKLVREQLSLLLESKSEITIQDFASTADELLQKASRNHPHVVLFCLMDDENENIEVMPQLFEVSPETKVVILSTLNGKLDQKRVLKLGAAGIIGANQREEVLIRAIRQVSQGEVFLNQRLIAQLLGNDSSEIFETSPTSEHRGFYKNDQLTNRELEVIKEIALGLTNKEISKTLSISEATVRHHLSSIYGKLNVGDRLNLVIYAYQYRIVKHSDDRD